MPHAPTGPARDARSPDDPPRAGRTSVVVGLTLIALGVCLVVVAQLYGMLRSLETIERLAHPTPGDLAHGVYWSLYPLVLGVVVGGIGVAFLIFGLVRRAPRAGAP